MNFSEHLRQSENKKAKVYREYDKSDMTIGASCDAILKLSDEEKMFHLPKKDFKIDFDNGKSHAVLKNCKFANKTYVRYK